MLNNQGFLLPAETGTLSLQASSEYSTQSARKGNMPNSGQNWLRKQALALPSKCAQTLMDLFRAPAANFRVRAMLMLRLVTLVWEMPLLQLKATDLQGRELLKAAFHWALLLEDPQLQAERMFSGRSFSKESMSGLRGERTSTGKASPQLQRTSTAKRQTLLLSALLMVEIWPQLSRWISFRAPAGAAPFRPLPRHS